MAHCFGNPRRCHTRAAWLSKASIAAACPMHVCPGTRSPRGSPQCCHYLCPHSAAMAAQQTSECPAFLHWKNPQESFWDIDSGQKLYEISSNLACLEPDLPMRPRWKWWAVWMMLCWGALHTARGSQPENLANWKIISNGCGSKEPLLNYHCSQNHY